MRFRPGFLPLSSVSNKLVRVLAAAAAITACSGQGEGQLCNPKAGNNGNDDCSSGLTCQSRPTVVISMFGICCPPNGKSSTSACNVTGASIDASSAPPEASTAETGADADATSAPPDAASPEAGADADASPAPSEASALETSADAAAEAAIGADASDAATE
jgi:hypothetical protein